MTARIGNAYSSSMPATHPKRLKPNERLVWSAVTAQVVGSLTNKRKPKPSYVARLAAEYGDAAVIEFRHRCK